MDRDVQVAGQLVREPLPGVQDAIANLVFVKQSEEEAEKVREAMAMS
jgi:hypothetical protein